MTNQSQKTNSPRVSKGRYPVLTKFIAGLGVVLLSGTLLTGCLSKNPAGTPNNVPAKPSTQTPVTPSTKLTYTTDIKPILDQRCTSCHSSTGRASKLPLTSYQEVKVQVKPGDATNSRLYQSLNGGSMTGKADTQETETIKKWIDHGAVE